MKREKILFVCGSLNQTTQMHRIAEHLPDYEHAFTPYYGGRGVSLARRLRWIEMTIAGQRMTERCLDYLRAHRLPIDPEGRASHDARLAFLCSDLVYPPNLRKKPVILVQEGMVDPPNALLPMVRRADHLPRWLGGTAATGLSHRYARFCVASDGFRDLFESRGVRPESMRVTGIPNFDDCRRYETESDFPLEGYVLCCTSDVREVFGREDRRAFIERARRIAKGRRLVFKLHPNERRDRAAREIARFAPEAIVLHDGSAEHLVARCRVLVCSYSSLALVGLALGKEVHSVFPTDELKRLLPEQHGRAAENIAAVARELLGERSTRPGLAADAALEAVA